MVAHQNTVQNRRIKTLRRLVKQLHKASAIPLIVTYQLTRIAPRAQVIDRAFKFYAQRPSHAPHMANDSENVKYLDFTPFSSSAGDTGFNPRVARARDATGLGL